MKVLLVVLAALNLGVFLAFGLDKWRAARRGRRIPEAWLLLPSAAGGCVGAWIGSSVFRHKTRKRSFRLKLVLATLANGLWLWGAWALARGPLADG